MQYTGLYQSQSTRIGLHSHVCGVLYEGDVGRTGTTREACIISYKTENEIGKAFILMHITLEY